MSGKQARGDRKRRHTDVTGDTLADETVNAYVASVVTDAGSDAVIAKLKNKTVLLDNPPKEFALSSVREAKKKAELTRLKKQKPSSRERRALQQLAVPRAGHDYRAYLPLHDMWLQYMESVLPSVQQQASDKSGRIGIDSVLVRVDYHGAYMTVIQSTSPPHVGIAGILVQETENTMKLVTKSNELKIIPKKGSIFMCRVSPVLVAKLYGDHICYRSSERTVKRFKAKDTVDL